MKKILVTMLIGIMSLFLLVGCGKKETKEPETVRYEIESSANTAIEIAEDYLKKVIDAENAFMKIRDFEKNYEQLSDANAKEDEIITYISEVMLDIAEDENRYNTDVIDSLNEDLQTLKDLLG